VGGEVAPTEAPPEPTAVVIPTTEVPATYVLQKGEFPYCIARRFNVDAGALLSLNGWGVNSVVSPGTVVKIPKDTTWSSGPRALKNHPTSYTVVAGDTIYSIACAFGDVDPNAIIVVNGLESPYTLTPGQVLQIP
jgi:LysM repeat protein